MHQSVGGPPHPEEEDGLFWSTATEQNYGDALGKTEGSVSWPPPPSIRSAWRNLEDVPHDVTTGLASK